MTNEVNPGQMSFDSGANEPQSKAEKSEDKRGLPKRLPVLGNKYGEPGFEELFDSDTVVDHDKVDSTPPYQQALREYEQKQAEAVEIQEHEEHSMKSFEAILKSSFETSSSEFILNFKDYVDRFVADVNKEKTGGESEGFYLYFFGILMAHANNVPGIAKILKNSPDYDRYQKAKEEHDRFRSNKRYRDWFDQSKSRYR